MTTGQLIKAARKRAGLTQKELGEKLCLTYQTVAQWENDLRNPKVETIQRIAAALSVSFRDLVSKEDLAKYEDGFREGVKVDQWQHGLLDALWEKEGYSYDDAEVRLINAFSRLNDDGRGKVINLAEDLTEIPRYQRTPAAETPTPSPEGTDTTPDKKPSEEP